MHSFSRFALSLLCLMAIPPEAESQAPASVRIDTIAPRSVLELPFEFQSGTFTLPGTLTLPANYSTPIPVTLIVAGSGPTDRNGNAVGPLRAQDNSNLYAILAWQLGEAGIASVRYDKRIVGENVHKVDMTTTSIDDFVADAGIPLFSIPLDLGQFRHRAEYAMRIDRQSCLECALTWR